MRSRTYDVFGAKFCIRGEDEMLADTFSAYLSPFAAPPTDGATYLVDLIYGRAGAPAEGHQTFDGELLSGVPAQVYQSRDARHYVLPGRLSICIDGGGARMAVEKGCDRNILAYAAIHIVDSGLAAHGQFIVHGAALRMPGNAGRALLLLAPSGRGKTTTALALALAGYALMTDDAIIVSRGEGGAGEWFAWGLPRSLKVHRETAAMMPAIGGLLGTAWDESGEQVLTTDRLSKLVAVVPAQRLGVAAVAVLGARTGGPHLVSRLAKTEALRLLAEDNVFQTRDGVPDEQLKRFQILSGLVRTIPTYEIGVGRDLSKLGAELQSALASN